MNLVGLELARTSHNQQTQTLAAISQKICNYIDRAQLSNPKYFILLYKME